jgi:RHS repeat-associated protein
MNRWFGMRAPAQRDPRWLIADRQGSIIATTSASGVATPLAYGPYGEPQAWTGPGGAMLSRFRYTGQAALPELQLYHYKARVYDPRLGRFLQTDPIGYKDGLNLYAYVGGDPINRFDASGMKSELSGCDSKGSHGASNCKTIGIKPELDGVPEITVPNAAGWKEGTGPDKPDHHVYGVWSHANG